MQPTATVVTRHYYSAVPVNMLSHSEAFLVYVTAMPAYLPAEYPVGGGSPAGGESHIFLRG